MARSDADTGAADAAEAYRFVQAALDAGLGADGFVRLREALGRLGPDELLRRLEATPHAAQARAAASSRKPLRDIVDVRHVAPQVRARTWDQLVEHLVGGLGRSGVDIDPVGLRAALARDPRAQGWLLGSGVALPHLSLPGLPGAILALATLADGFAVHGPDGRPIRIVFLLLDPRGDPERHLALLARVAGMCTPASKLGLLLAARTERALRDAVAILDEAPPPIPHDDTARDDEEER